MTYQQVRIFLYRFAGDLGRLMKNGDPLARKVYEVYKAHHRHPLDVKLQNELIAVVKDYALRGLMLTEIDDLERRFGINHPDKPDDSRH